MYKRLALIAILSLMLVVPAMADNHYVWDDPNLESASPDLYNVTTGTNVSAVQVNPPGLSPALASFYFRFTNKSSGFEESDAVVTGGANCGLNVGPGPNYRTMFCVNWPAPANASHLYISAIVRINGTAPGRIVSSWYVKPYVAPPYGPIADYTCNIGTAETQKPVGFGLICNGNSTASPAITSQSWTLTNPDASVYTISNTSIVRTLTQEGWYGLNYSACNVNGCGYKNTTQLVNITSGLIPTTGISFWVHIYDPLKYAKIANSDLIVRNTTYFSSFRYLSSTVGSFLISSTYGTNEKITAGQYVNLTGIAPGYQTGNATVSVPYDGWEYILNLVATSDVPTGANATLIVQTIDLYTSGGVDGATITITNNTIPYSSSKLTNAGGSATFSSIPAGTYQISASKTGYQSSTTSWPAGASTVTSANIGLLPVGATPVVTGTAGNPLFDADGNPIVGYDANGNPITAAPTQDTRTAAEKDAGMADLLRNNGEALIMLFIVFTIIYMIKGIGK